MLWSKSRCHDVPGGERSADREHGAEDESDLSAARCCCVHTHSGIPEQTHVQTAADTGWRPGESTGSDQHHAVLSKSAWKHCILRASVIITTNVGVIGEINSSKSAG